MGHLYRESGRGKESMNILVDGMTTLLNWQSKLNRSSRGLNEVITQTAWKTQKGACKEINNLYGEMEKKNINKSL